jgi:hypothetical protein
VSKVKAMGALLLARLLLARLVGVVEVVDGVRMARAKGQLAMMAVLPGSVGGSDDDVGPALALRMGLTRTDAVTILTLSAVNPFCINSYKAKVEVVERLCFGSVMMAKLGLTRL